MKVSFKKVVILSLVSIGILIIGISFSRKPVQSPTIPEESNKIVGEVFIYKNSETNQSLKVSYDNNSDTATIYPNEINQVVFKATTTGSGARYANDEQHLILWNKGDDISLYLSDSLIFTGTLETDSKVSNSPDLATSTISKDDENNLSGKIWVWKETILKDGQKIIPQQAGKFTITFRENGKVSGTTDCNSFGGSYAVTDTNLKFGPFMSTLMACLSINSQETEFHNMLEQTNSYAFDNKGNLVFKLNNLSTVVFEAK